MRIIYEKRAVILRCAVRTLACIILLVFLLDTLRQAKLLLPDGMYYTPGDVTFHTLENARTSCPTLKISGWRETDAAVMPDPVTGQTQVETLRFIDAWYFDFWDIELVAGSGFHTANPAYDVQSVLISEDLACRLFFTRDAVGRELTVDGQVLTVSGVYARPKALLHRISGIGKDVLFVPYQSKLASDVTVTHLLVCASAGGAPAESDLYVLDAECGNRLRYSMHYDLSTWKTRLTSLVRLYLFTFAVIFTISQLRVFVNDIRRLLAWYRSLDRTDVIKKSEAAQRLWRPVLYAVVCITALALTSFPLVIPVYFFPEDRHLLNISHYLDLFVAGFVERNATAYSYVQTVYDYAVWGIHIVGLVLAGVFAGLMGFLGNRESAKYFLTKSDGK